jgi:hypothetical protein
MGGVCRMIIKTVKWAVRLAYILIMIFAGLLFSLLVSPGILVLLTSTWAFNSKTNYVEVINCLIKELFSDIVYNLKWK